MNVIAVTQKGIGKKENEDRIIVGKSIVASGTLHTEIEEGVLAIADGVGGHNAGSVASHFVANSLCNVREISVEQMQEINNELIELSELSEELKGMATTLVGVNLFDCKAQLFNVGNSRVYLLQSRKYLKQITTDDTTLNYLLATGQLSLAEVENFERKNEITACFGGGSYNLFKIKLSNVDLFTSPIMITSDGIHDYLTVDNMEDIIEEFGLSVEMCQKMINVARENGSLDDASIILGGI